MCGEIDIQVCAADRIKRETVPGRIFGGYVKSLWVLLLAGLMLSGWGGSSRSSSSQNSGPLAGNWQFTLASPSDGSFLGSPNPACASTSGTPLPICSGGFLLQNQGSVTGALVYSIQVPPPPSLTGSPPTLCNSGSAPVTGTINGQNVTLTVVAGTQTFTLNGTLSADGSTMMGTYASDGKGCGRAETGLQWSATSVQPLTGAVQGIFHSAAGYFHTVTGDVLVISNQNFPVSGVLTQGANIGASNATVTGTLTFQGYPCLDTAYVNGQISGNSVFLQIIASNGLNAGQIGSPGLASDTVSPVVFESTAQGGYVLKGTKGYGVNTNVCPVGNAPGDSGDVCLAVGNSTSCTQPISLSPAFLTFPPQALGSTPTTQTITLTNTDPSNATLTGLSIANLSEPTSAFSGFTDFTGVHNFTEQDNCASAPQATFSLASQQSCSITILFAPQQSCPWLPFAQSGNPPSATGAPPTLCPFPLPATLTVNSPTSADNLTSFALPILGTGLSAVVPSTPELDFGAEALTETSPAQVLSFTNQGTFPVQILPALSQPCVNVNQSPHTLLRPLTPGTIAGLQVDTGNISASGSTIQYLCDSDLTSGLPNFQISADTCTGRLLPPQVSCTIQVRFVPQPSTSLISGLDYFLELNTLQCTRTTTSDCEIDSGRFPVELTANMPSPLRMSPGAGLDFGNQAVGQASAPLTIALFNDPRDPNAATINFTGNLVRGDYAETDDCGASLASGSSCTLTITFKPKIAGFDPGTLTIAYTVGQTQTIHLRGTGQ